MASDGGGKLKLKRPQSASKPYERRKSLYRKVTDTVKDLLSPSWLPDILATVRKSPPKQSNNPISIDEEEDEEEMFMDPPARNQLNTYNGPPQIGLTSKLENKLPAPQPKRSQLPVNTTVQSYNRKPTFTSSLPSTSYTSSHPPPSSRYSLDNNSVTRPPLRREERPSSTQTSSSLSGLPIPQAEEGLALSEDKLKMLKDDFSADAFKASKRTSVIESTRQHDRSSNVSTTSNMDGQSKRPRIWGHEMSRTAVARPVESAVKDRPAFKASLFGSPMMETSLLGDDTLNESSFYSGKTTFGGNSALRNRNKLNVTAPYQTALPIRKQMKPKLANNSFSAVTSSSARRILESLERMSTPLSDVKKIPMENPSVTDSLLSFTPSSYRRQSFQPSLLSRRSLEVPSRSGPPTSQIRTHSIASISRNRQTSTPISSRTTSIQKQTIQESQGENTMITDTSSISKIMPKSRLEDNTITPSLSNSNKTSGKIKRDKTHHYSSKKQDIEDEVVEIPNLKSDFTLPVSNLPQIQFTATPIGKVDDLTAKTVVGSSSTDLTYTFSSPIHQPQKPLTVISPVGKEQGFTFSSPLKADEDQAKSSQISATVGFSFVSSTPSTAPKPKSMLGNGGIGLDIKPSPVVSVSEKSSVGGFQPSSTLKQGSVMDILGGNKSSLKQGSVMDVLGKKTNSPSPLKQGSVMDVLGKKDSEIKKTNSSSGVSLAQLFAKPAGTWTCDTCMIENNGEKTKCAACETPKPSSQPTGRLIASEKTVSNKTASSSEKPSLSTLFNKQSGTWSCDVCMVQNKPDTDKCAACETPKPGAKPAAKQTNSLSSLFAKKAGSWDCDACMVQNKPDVEKCVACETPKPGSKSTGGSLKSSGLSTGTSGGTGQLTSSGFKFVSNDTSATSASGFKFGTSLSSDSKTSAPSVGGGFKFDGGKDSIPSTGGFKIPGSSTTDSKCVFGGSTLPSEQSTTSGFSFGNKDNTESKQSSGFSFGNKDNTESKQSSGFSFGNKDNTESKQSSGFSFGQKDSLESKQGTGFSFGNKDTTAVAKPTSGFNVTNQDKSSGAGISLGNPVISSETDNSKVKATVAGFTFGAPLDSSKLGENKNLSDGGIQFNSGVKISSDNSQLNGKSVGGFVFGDSNKLKETNNNDLEKAKSENKGGFGQSNPTGSGVGGFTFGASKLEQPKTNSLGVDSSVTPPNNIFAFGGGTPANSSSGGLGVFPSTTPFNSSGKRSIEEDTNEPSSKKAFSFGGPTAAPISNGPFQFGASTEAKPTALVQPENKTSFNFNAGGNSGFNFDKPAETKPQTSAVFSFGAGNSTTPAMGFGNTSTASAFGTVNTSTASAFGTVNTSTASAFGTVNSTAPSFGAGNTSPFGNSSGFGNANNSFSGAPAAFGSFGGNGSTSGSNHPTPAFGASSATPAFGAAGQTQSFGNSTTSFGAPATNNAGFNFNATPNLSFGSGGGTGASTFQFNAKTNDSGSATTAQTPQTTTFVFGAQPAPQAAPTPGFSAPAFGSATPAFSIGTSDSVRKIKKAVRRKK